MQGRSHCNMYILRTKHDHQLDGHCHQLLWSSNFDINCHTDSGCHSGWVDIPILSQNEVINNTLARSHSLRYLAVVKPPMAKIANVFGRLEAFSLSIFLYVIGYIQQAGANNVKTFASAQIFYSAGETGLQILIQIFIADTTNLTWRALFSSLVDLPFLFTVWVGPVIAGSIRTHTTWRWGYGIWAIVLPVAFLPLAISLIINHRKAARRGTAIRSPYEDQSAGTILKSLWYELDFFGLILLSAAVSLVLLPLTLANEAHNQWRNGSMIAMLVIGGICLILFPFWERSKKLAPHAFFPRDLFRQRTVVAGVAWAFFYYSKFSCVKLAYW